MAKAGYCDACGANVWIAADGRCAQGHDARHVSGMYEAAAQPAKRSHVGIIVAVVAGLLVLGVFVAGVMAAISIPVFNSARDQAQVRQCTAELRVLDASRELGLIERPAEVDPSLADLVEAGIIPEIPACPNAGAYSFVNGVATCSVHGNVEALETVSDPSVD